MNNQQLSNNLTKAFSKVLKREESKIGKCSLCGVWTSKKRLEEGEGACYKCWDK